MKQETGLSRKNTKDQFYTKESVSKECVDILLSTLPEIINDFWIEPSAGNGSFIKATDRRVNSLLCMDIEPKNENIQKQDYLEWWVPGNEKQDYVVFGNPPFGRQSSLAKKFISKSCQFAKVIAFILPKSFTKPSMFSAFDKKFHLVKTVFLEKNSFLVNGILHDVPSVFQIWLKKDTNRESQIKITPLHFKYVKNSECCDIAFRRVGSNAGKCYKIKEVKSSSHYFIKFDAYIKNNLDSIIEKINETDFPSNTTGPRSLSKTEINDVINTITSSYS